MAWSSVGSRSKGRSWKQGRPILLRSGEGSLPSEFRIFRPGLNSSTKGDVLFDEQAAQLVMSAYREHGADMMIDLEHLSVSPEEVTGDGRNHDPDARGWCQLELRSGELWAVNVSWTADGAERLEKRTQRYVSPAFFTDEDGRVTDVFNIALTAIPATHDAQPLVASAKGIEIMDPEKVRDLLRLLRSGKKPHEVMRILSIDVKQLQAVVKAMGGDPGADLASMMGTVAEFAQRLKDAATGKSAEEAPMEAPAAMAEDAPTEEPTAMAGAAPDEQLQGEKPDEKKAMSRLFAATGKPTISEALSEIGRLKVAAIEGEKAQQEAARQRAALEAGKRRQLVAELVKLGRETPATAWENSDGVTPRGYLASMPMAELEQRVKLFGGTPNLQAAPEPGGAPRITSPDIEISEYEAKRLQVFAKRKGCDPDQAMERYTEIRLQQLEGARQRGHDINRFGRRIEQDHVLASVQGTIRPGYHRQLWTNPVKPIEQFGTTSQRAMEEFRTDYMVNLAVLPPDWVDQVGDVLPSGSLKQTYPLDFSIVSFAERMTQSGKAETPQSAEIPLDKKEFRAAKQGDARRIRDGDFAYLKSWLAGAAQMARARYKLRSSLVVTLLEANGVWAVSTEFASGLDGENFFSASHLVNPFSGTDTWSNYQASATPLTAANLTAEKQSQMLVPHFDGEHLAATTSHIMHPTSLQVTARDLLTVQDLILSGALSGGGDGTMGPVRNPHFQSGLTQVLAPQLAGSDTTADYYLISEGIIEQGFVPFVVAEDAAEEVLEWNEDSDFYKDSGNIKMEVKLYANAALLWPHGIRLVKGS